MAFWVIAIAKTAERWSYECWKKFSEDFITFNIFQISIKFILIFNYRKKKEFIKKQNGSVGEESDLCYSSAK